MAGHAVFDLDGTLVDSVPVLTVVLNAMLAERGVKPALSEAQVRPHATAGGLAMVRDLLGDPWGPPAMALEAFRARYGALPTPPESLYPGIPAALSTLRDAGVGLSVVSNKSQGLCEKVLRELGLESYFGAIVGTSPEIPLKPDPTGLDRALSLTGGSRRLCCVVGDSAPDHALARTVDAPFILASWGYGEGEAALAGARVAGTPAAIPDLVLRALSNRLAA
jgi:phosphoglycolate phosphatase